MFSPLAHPARLQILNELRSREACVCHLQEVLGRPQAYVSQQLRVLREASLVQDRKEGQMVYYSLANTQIDRLLQEVFGPPREPTEPPDCPCPKCQDR
jgi:ArsR family transcriptional regulator